jgi:hypothetical protein
LVKIEDIGPADEGDALRRSVIATYRISGGVRLFEELVVNDRRGLRPFLNVAAKIEGLLEGEPERRLKLRGAEQK